MLLAREIERVASDQPMIITRMSVELLRPTGLTSLEVRSRVVRAGRKVQLVESSLWRGDTEVARATALRIRASAVDVPEHDEPPPHPEPEALEQWSGTWGSRPAYHVLSVDIRGPENPPGQPAAGWAWFRLKLPLLAGEEPTPFQRVCAAADFPNGISYLVDPRRTSFVNPDLTVYVHRLPADEWVMVDARTWLEPNGMGMAEGALYDRAGRIGRSMQALIVESRG